MGILTDTLMLNDYTTTKFEKIIAHLPHNNKTNINKTIIKREGNNK